MTIVSIDIGSTWTKGAAFSLSSDGTLALLNRASHPTTVHDLSEGFSRVLGGLVGHDDEFELFYSSSAKGGLAVAAVGLVPELTSEMAKMTACSSGAKVTQTFAYELSDDDVSSLMLSAPDIILLTGGSDGGNSFYPVRNAGRIAGADLAAAIVFAGNRSAKDAVARILQGKHLVCTENVLPALDSPNPEPARAAIRDIFLTRITSGKGLDRIVADTGREPCPTPYALYEFCQSLAAHAPELGEFLLVDMGGATTDVYSVHNQAPTPGTVHRGLPEPRLKRSVEGDLGMRVSAITAAEAAREALGSVECAISDLASYAAKVKAAPEHLAGSVEEQHFDELLAGINVATSVMRHVGRAHEVATADGVVTVQTGRDLSSVRTIIGTGGYLSHTREFSPAIWLSQIGVDRHGKRVLSPRCERYLRDPMNILPLLANVSRGFPGAAARAAVNLLTPNQPSKPPLTTKVLLAQ
ncbi:glutamate mutase L (plasmid) [Ensifer adhaerens]|uniref:glutamate mutase L n=1 Tax=Ensifer adhaerens TaxID=106592 RepID=UPI0023A940D9|nr:glutamate mutase L [Ensifer adhaerens]WDZ81624.1 glutamate mutase L [Ensifer adhaerens]